MSEEQKFDDSIRSKLSDSGEIPPPEVWNVIERKRKRRIAAWWFNGKKIAVIALLILAVGTGVYLKWNKESNKVVSEKLQSVSGIDKTEKQNATIEKIETGNSIATIETKNSNKEILSVKLKSQKTTELIIEPKKEKGHNTEIGLINFFEPIKSNLSQSKRNSQKGTTTIIANGTTKNNPQEKHKQIATENKNEIIQKDSIEKTLSTKIVKEFNDEEVLIVNDFALSDTLISTSEIKAEVMADTTSKDAIEKPVTTENLSPKILTDSAKAKRFSLEILAGYDFVTQQLSPKNNATDYLEARKNSEQTKNGFNIDLKAGYKITEHVILKTGLHYSQFEVEYNYAYKQQLIYTHTDSLIGFIVNPFGPSVAITFYGTKIDTTIVLNQFGSANRYNFYSIPLTIGYLYESKKWGVALNAGVLINEAFKASGKLIGADLKSEVQINNSGNTPYKKTAGVALLTNASFYYKATNRIKFIIEPEYQFPLTDLTTSSYALHERYKIFSLKGGVGFDF